MSIVYSPDCDCDLVVRGFAFPDLVITHVSTPEEAYEALTRAQAEVSRSFTEVRPYVERYHSVHGPGGHVLAVRP